jgi:hypothetical protein
MAKVLLVVTAASYWTLKDGTRHPTGYWAEEFAAPYSALSLVAPAMKSWCPPRAEWWPTST